MKAKGQILSVIEPEKNPGAITLFLNSTLVENMKITIQTNLITLFHYEN